MVWLTGNALSVLFQTGCPAAPYHIRFYRLNKVTAAGQMMIPRPAARSWLGALGEIVDPDLPGRTPAGRAGSGRSRPGWGWGGTACLPAPCLAPPLGSGLFVEGTVPLAGSGEAGGAAFSLSSGVLVHTALRVCAQPEDWRGPCLGGAGGLEARLSSRPTTGGVLHLPGWSWGARHGPWGPLGLCLGSCPEEAGVQKRAPIPWKPSGPQTGNAIPNSSYRFFRSLVLHVLHNFLFKET